VRIAQRIDHFRWLKIALLRDHGGQKGGAGGIIGQTQEIYSASRA
jgi:hypothetical protein